MAIVLLSSTPEETGGLGERLGRQLRGDEVVLVRGELGAGKTVFIKGLASGLGIAAGDVVSPSYVLMNLYRGRCDLYHFDLYRLGPLPPALESPVDEYIGAGVLAVEWAQYLDDSYFALPQAVAVTIAAAAGGGRSIRVHSRLPYIELA
jgi:tRNA threonylcarbamoyladenosine biosynthesis protein TsaE